MLKIGSIDLLQTYYHPIKPSLLEANNGYLQKRQDHLLSQATPQQREDYMAGRISFYELGGRSKLPIPAPANRPRRKPPIDILKLFQETE